MSEDMDVEESNMSEENNQDNLDINEIETPWSSIGYITYKRTYSRKLDENRTEEFKDTIERVMNACETQLNVGFDEDEKERLRYYLLSLKGSVAGRFLWQLGTETVNKLGLASLQNCAACVVNEPIRPFTWTFDMLMLGSGVGYNIQREHVYKLPPVKENFICPVRADGKDADFIVPDTREGWVQLLHHTLHSAFYGDGVYKSGFSYSTHCIRSKGAAISGFGGVASGPEDLVKGITQISIILEDRAGKQLRSIDCLDIMNIIGSVVVAGNVRRCLPEGTEIHTKNGLENIENIEVGTEVLTTKGYRKVLNKFDQGNQNIVRIKTQDGHFDCTSEHRMAVLTSIDEYTFKRANELEPGDRLCTSHQSITGTQTELPSWTYTRPKNSTTCVDITIPELDADMSWFIGLFHADGYVYDINGHGSLSVVFNEHDYDIGVRAQAQMARWGVKSRLSHRKNENSWELRTTSKQLSLYFMEHIKRPKIPLKVPQFIKSGSEDVRLAYVCGVLDGDGSAHNRPVHVCTTVYGDWALELQNLLYSCGIESRLNIGSDEWASRVGWQKLYHVVLITNYSKYKLVNSGFLSKELRIGQKSHYSNGYLCDWITKFKSEMGVYSNSQVTVDTLSKYYKHDIKLNPVEVVEIVDLSVSVPTWDIEVEEMHEFFANGYLTHNSAQIAIGDSDDIQFLKAKNWSEGNIPNWRSMSNNSVVCNDIKTLPEEFWKTYDGGSEPYGLINLKLSQNCGRIGETQYKDKDCVCFNPCLTYDTPLLTDNGYLPIGSLVNEAVNIWNGEEWSEVKPFSTGVNEIVRVNFTDGSHLDCTPYHKFLIIDGFNNSKVQRIPAEELQSGMKLQKWDMPVIGYVQNIENDNVAYSQGFYSGDGNLDRNASHLYEPKYVCENRLIGTITQHNTAIARKYWNHGPMLSKNYVPINETITYKLNWLAGLLDSDGVVTRDKNGNGLQICSIDYQFLLDLRLMLNTLGCRTKVVALRDAAMRLMPDGHGGSKYYNCKEINRILIGNSDTHLLSKLGLNCSRLNIHGEEPQRDARQYIRVKNVEWLGVEEETFCVTEPKLNQMTVNGIVTGNCAEQSLANFETCCLSDIFLPNVESYEELLDMAKMLYRINKHSLSLPCHNKETEEIVHKNMRMGIGITGYLQSTEEQKLWLSPLYIDLRKYDKEYSKAHNWPISIKITTTKPSGSLSLLPGVTPGVHPAYAQYMIRRIRIASDHKLVDLCMNNGYPVEFQRNFDGTLDHSTVVVEFPYAYPDGTVLAAETTAISQLEWVKRLQTEWSDNSVSCTVYYRKEELPEIREYLRKNYNKTCKTLSFLLHSEHGFDQAPYEEITKEEYDLRVSNCNLITSIESAEFDGGEECVKGGCPIK